MRGPTGTGRGGVSMDGGRQDQGAEKGEGVRGCRLPSQPCFFEKILGVSAFCLDEGGCERITVLYAHIHEFLFISFYSCSCQRRIEYSTFNIFDSIIGRHAGALLSSPYEGKSKRGKDKKRGGGKGLGGQRSIEANNISESLIPY